jgi:hypothetical protein
MIILNEKEYAKDCLRRKEIDQNKPYKTLFILAKYYYHECGYRKRKIEKLLMEFVQETYPSYEYSKAIWEENIEKIAKKAGKHKLHEIDGVGITKNELETIKRINNAVLERLAFTMLCLAKLGNLRNPKNNNWVNNDAKEVFALARISCNVSERYMNLGILGQLSLLEFPKKIDNLSCRVTFIDPDGSNELFISDFRELGYEYLNYLGGNFSRCAECGKLFRNNKRKDKKYCSNCVGYVPQGIKKVTCIDCGKVFEVDAKNNQTNRCDDCYKEYRRNYYRDNKRKQREMSTEQIEPKQFLNG